MAPLFSVVIPTHNRPQHLLKAVQSVIAQSFDSWELIIVDDGSGPETETLLKSLCQERITRHRHLRPRGVAAARNSGLHLANGALVAFLDDDDQMQPGFISAMACAFQLFGDSLDFAWPLLHYHCPEGGYQGVGPQQSCLIRKGHGPVLDKSYAALMDFGGSGTVFRRRGLLANNGFDESLRVSEDRDLVFRLLAAGYGCSQVPEAKLTVQVHRGPRLSTSANLQRQLDTDSRLVERHRAFFAEHPALAVRFLNMLAKRQHQAGQRDQARDTLRQVLHLQPMNPRAWRRRLLW